MQNNLEYLIQYTIRQVIQIYHFKKSKKCTIDNIPNLLFFYDFFIFFHVYQMLRFDKNNYHFYLKSDSHPPKKFVLFA